jgi:hypothetical protein
LHEKGCPIAWKEMRYILGEAEVQGVVGEMCKFIKWKGTGCREKTRNGSQVQQEKSSVTEAQAWPRMMGANPE